MEIYGGIDLHSSNNYIALIDQEGRRVYNRRLPNNLEEILDVLGNYEDDITGVAVESTYNWYWLVDGLMKAGYVLHLANPAGMQRYSGLKHCDDSSDAIWLAEMLRLGVLPEGYIYPPETRPLRDLLRKRSQLVKLRTGLILSFQSMVARNLGFSVKGVDLSKKAAEYQEQYWSDRPELSLIADANLTVIDSLNRQIDLIEKAVRHRWKIKEGYPQLLSIPGVGYIIGMTIELETGPISRFGRVGDYVSYCRKVNSQWTSNNKLKGSGNRKNGNRYLAWAFSEAAEFARRYNESCRAFYNRKLKKNHMMVARSALAHKLARAAYYIMRDNVPFDERKLFS